MKKILGPNVGYCDLLDYEINEKLKANSGEKFFPLRPSAAGYCSRRLTYDLMEYMGYGKYDKEPQTPEVYRLLNLGHSVEYSALKNLELLPGFKLRYKQQSVHLFRLDSHDGSTPGPLIEGSIDVVLWSDNYKAILDVKSQKDGWSSHFKTRWDETLDKYNKMSSLQRIGESAYYADSLDALVEELGDDFLVDNLLQVNLYCMSEFAKVHEIDHGVIYKYNKNTSQHYEIRFRPSRALYDKVKDKFNRVYQAVQNKKPESIHPDCKLGTMRAAFCPYKCWGEDSLKAWFKTFPAKVWAKPASEIKGATDLFIELDQHESSADLAEDIKSKILDLMLAKKVIKVKLKDGRVYEAKFYKSPKPHYELKRSKE